MASKKGRKGKRPSAKPPAASSTPTARSKPARRFSSRLEAHAWAQEHFTDWKQSLRAEESAALTDYKGGAYVFVNAYLRGQTDDPIDQARAEELIPHLDSALAKCRLPQAVVVHRFYDVRAWLENFSELVGAEIHEPAYLSSSLLPDNPLQRARAKEGIVAEICLPAGLCTGYLDLIRDRKEWELLLPRGTPIRVTQVSAAEHIKYITAEVIR